SFDMHDQTMTVRRANALLFERYLAIIGERESEDGDETSLANLAWMCRTALAGIETLPIDKINRWLGFVQGVLAIRGLITVQGERDFSRPLFHAAYHNEGTAAPATRDRARG